MFNISFAQNVGIGTNTPSARLDISSNNSGILIPRLTTTARNAILNPAKSLLVYDSTAKQFYYHDGTGWQNILTSSANLWQQNGAGGNEIKNTNAGGFWSAANKGLISSANNTTNPPTAPVSGVGTRLMWIPSRSAFRVGTIYDDGISGSNFWDPANIGLFSFATGENKTASGYATTAMGSYTTASKSGQIAMGYATSASGGASTAMGGNTTASGECSTAMGKYTIAIGDYSTASGYNSFAMGIASTAMGSGATASGDFSSAIGYGATASGKSSTAFGQVTTASWNYSTAMGNYGNTYGHVGSFIIHDNINENIYGITQNSLDNQMIMKFDGGFGFYSGDASVPSMGFEKTQGLSVYASNIRAISGIVTANGITLTVLNVLKIPLQILIMDSTAS